MKVKGTKKSTGARLLYTRSIILHMEQTQGVKYIYIYALRASLRDSLWDGENRVSSEMFVGSFSIMFP